MEKKTVQSPSILQETEDTLHETKDNDNETIANIKREIEQQLMKQSSRANQADIIDNKTIDALKTEQPSTTDFESLQEVEQTLSTHEKSITVIRSMIHSTENVDLDESLNDLANSSNEGVSSIFDQSESFTIEVTPKKYKSSESLDDDENNFTVGSRVEAKDFDDVWHLARILEEDIDEMEVLVHYDSGIRNDEWISTNSSRIRKPSKIPTVVVHSLPIPKSTQLSQSVVEEAKTPLSYAVGEKCYARWSDNRRFPATVHAVIEGDKYQVVFDDGITRIQPWHCLSKMKKGAPFVDLQATTNPPEVPTVPLHRHLFDPKVDHLGSKSERRMMKKQLDIKALFNIGKKSKKRKMSASPNEPVPVKKLAKKQPAVRKSDDSSKVVEIPILDIKDEASEEIDTVIPEPLPVTVAETRTIKTEDPPNTPLTTGEDGKKKPKKLSIRKSKDLAYMQYVTGNCDRLVVTPVQQEAPKEEVTEEAFMKTDTAIDESGYSININDGLNLIAQAVETFEVEKVVYSQPPAPLKMEPKTEAMPERYIGELAEGQWCCHWIDGEPQGEVVEESDSAAKVKEGEITLPRKSVMVEDKRLPPGWKKILVRRCYGTSAGKWDVVVIDPNNRRLRDKGEMRNYLTLNENEDLQSYEDILSDFSVHRKLAKRLGWDVVTDDKSRVLPLTPTPVVAVKKKSSLTPSSDGPPPKKKKRPLPLTPIVPEVLPVTPAATPDVTVSTPQSAPLVQTPKPGPQLGPQLGPIAPLFLPPDTQFFEGLPYVDGHVYVGSMKVQIIESLFRCPADGCYKNFRKDNLLRMHIKHYHRELRKMLGDTPKVADLAYQRTKIPENTVVPKLKCESELKSPKLKPLPKTQVDKPEKKECETYAETSVSLPTTPSKSETDKSLQDSPKLRNALEYQPTKKPKVLYPVKKEVKSEAALSEPEEAELEDKPKEDMNAFVRLQKLPEHMETENAKSSKTPRDEQDFEAAISTHTVTKPTYWKRKPKSPKKKDKKREGEKQMKNKKKKKSTRTNWADDEVEVWQPPPEPAPDLWQAPIVGPAPAVPPAPGQPPEPQFMISETGERIKIVHMKREEIINCHCGIGEEDGLMIQCDLCLCWQHAICHGYDNNTVPEKYTCSICLRPRRGRASRRFLHDQTWLYEGTLPGAAASDDALRRSHELTGNLLRLTQLLHTLRLKLHVATKKDHPKQYLWAKEWESGDDRPEPLHNVDLHEVFRDIGKENLPAPAGDEIADSQREPGELGSQVLLANLLASPNGTALDLPISTSELERLAKSVQIAESEAMRGSGPEPEAAIESSTCRKNLLRHIQKLQSLIDARLDSIEAQVAELESQDPSFEDDETPDYFPRTKQTIRMLHRDLGTMEELGNIT